MDTFLGLALTFFGLIATGSTLQCEVCNSFGTNCTGSIKTCETGQDTCAITLTEHTLIGTPMQSITKECASSSVCDAKPKYLHFGQEKELRSAVICCVGDACRTAIVQVPPAITQPNGKRCPACYTLTSVGCSDEAVNCVGPEVNCLDMTQVITYGSSVYKTIQKGCASESACEALRKDKTYIPGGSVETKTECKAAPVAF